MSLTPSLRWPASSFSLGPSSQSWLSWKENWANSRSSHLTSTQPGEATMAWGESLDEFYLS